MSDPDHRVDVEVTFDNSDTITYTHVRQWEFQEPHFGPGGHPAQWVIKPDKRKLPPGESNGYALVQAHRVLAIRCIIYKSEEES